MFALLFCYVAREEMIGLLTAYFDDSGTHDGATVVLLGGLLGDEHQWSAFERGWSSCLQNPTKGRGPIGRFHAFDLQHSVGEFAGWKRPESDNAFYNFRQVIIESGLLGYAIAVDIAAWNELVVGPLRTFLGDAERFCVSQCILKSNAIALAVDPQKDLKFVFDNRPHRSEANKRIFEIFQHFSRLERELPALTDIAFLGSTGCLPLQGADLVAYEYYRLSHDLALANGQRIQARPHWERLSETGRIHGDIALRPEIERISKQQVSQEYADAAQDQLGL